MKCSWPLEDISFVDYHSKNTFAPVEAQYYIVDVSFLSIILRIIAFIKLDLGGDMCVLAIDLTGDNYAEYEVVLGTPVYRGFCVKHDLQYNTITLYHML